MFGYFNPYEILGISSTASESEIRKAYRKLSLEYHPDRKPASEKEEAEKYFKQILKAYEMLTKPENFSRHNFFQSEQSSNDNAIIPYQEDLLPYDEVLYLEQEKNKFDFDLATNPNKEMKDFDIDWKGYLRRQHNINPIIIMDDNDIEAFIKLLNKPKNIEVTYNSEYLHNLDNEKIIEIIESAEKKYRYIPDCINENALLWIAEKEGCSPIYLFGTIHIDIDKFSIEDRFDDVFNHLIALVDIVYTEVEKNSISALGDIDDFITIKAYQLKKELRALENLQVILNTMSEEYFNSLKCQVDETEQISNFIRKYLSGVILGSLNEKDDNSELLKSAIKRNFFWLKDILFQSQYMKKTILVANGIGHNSGQYGLPNLLAHEGYKLTPLIKYAPETRQSIVRKLVFGNSDSFFQRNFNRKNSSVREENKGQELQIIPSRKRR